jgi:serine/threonine protein kinase
MGEVYLAKDTKLGREVALKILPETLTHDAERIARFRREAQVLAALNHSNIAHIYGLEQASNGVQALVLELVTPFKHGLAALSAERRSWSRRIARRGTGSGARPLSGWDDAGICRGTD